MKKAKKLYCRIDELAGGQYAIIDDNNNIVFGGDSACEDHYNKDYIREVFDRWDGSLNDDGHIDYDRLNFNTI